MSMESISLMFIREISSAADHRQPAARDEGGIFSSTYAGHSTKFYVAQVVSQRADYFPQANKSPFIAESVQFQSQLCHRG